ncbi:MAG: putative ABC transporter permease [Candidatus Kerfeldbacteria bacterium]|nr:putative ABC transporter permease [Candidatus Kerfeldbacteria bacterium]
MTLKHTLSIFIIFSILGWFGDTLVRTIDFGYWYSYNAFNIPFSPTYGLACVVILFMHQLMKTYSLRTHFFVYLITLPIYELIAGFVGEWVTHRKLWDYSWIPGNIYGYTTPFHALLWGVSGVLLVYWLDPLICRWLHITDPEFKKTSSR